MDKAKSLKELQAEEIQKLEFSLNASRPGRAQRDAMQEANSPVPLPTWVKKPTWESLFPKHLKNWEIRDQLELDRLKQKHAVQENTTKAFNENAQNGAARQITSAPIHSRKTITNMPKTDVQLTKTFNLQAHRDTARQRAQERARDDKEQSSRRDRSHDE